MEFSTTSLQGSAPVTILRPVGRLDGQTYKDLISKAAELYEAGTRNIILDLSEVSYISSAGVVALHTIALMLRGEPLPNLENGWRAMKMSGRASESGMQQHLKLLNPRAEVTSVLEMVGFMAFLEVFQDQEVALRAF